MLTICISCGLASFLAKHPPMDKSIFPAKWTKNLPQNVPQDERQVRKQERRHRKPSRKTSKLWSSDVPPFEKASEWMKVGEKCSCKEVYRDQGQARSRPGCSSRPLGWSFTALSLAGERRSGKLTVAPHRDGNKQRRVSGAFMQWPLGPPPLPLPTGARREEE